MPSLSLTWPTKAGRDARLKVVRYTPAGGTERVCAAVWQSGGNVRLASPLIRPHDGACEPRTFMRRFADAPQALDAFLESMTWLDAACFGASSPGEVAQACRTHPEWQLHCSPYGGTDEAMATLGELFFRSLKKATPMSEPLVRGCVIETVRVAIKTNPALAHIQMNATYASGVNVCSLAAGLDRPLLVTFLEHVASTDIIWRGVLAHQRMRKTTCEWSRCLLVMANATLSAPSFLTPKVVITDLSLDQIGAALMHLARR